MFKALIIFIIFIILLVVVVGFGVIRTVYRLFFGNNVNRTRTNNSQERRAPEQWVQEKRKEKIFSKEEGEYIDFEEIKDDDKK